MGNEDFLPDCLKLSFTQRRFQKVSRKDRKALPAAGARSRKELHADVHRRHTVMCNYCALAFSLRLRVKLNFA